MTEPEPVNIPSIADLHPEALRFLGRLAHEIDLSTTTVELGQWAAELFLALEHQLNKDGDVFASGARVPSMTTLSSPTLLDLRRLTNRARQVAERFGIGLDGDARDWCWALLAHIDHELASREPTPPEPPSKAEQAEQMVNAAYDSWFAAEEQAAARAKRPPSDLRGLKPWSQASGAAE